MPGAKMGISTEDPTMATLMKEHGYVTGQFGPSRAPGNADPHSSGGHAVVLRVRVLTGW
jgi:arylsulfatase A-like enzyme